MDNLEHPLGPVAHLVNVRDQILLARGKLNAVQHLGHIGGARFDGRHRSSRPGGDRCHGSSSPAWHHRPVNAEAIVGATTSRRLDPHQLARFRTGILAAL
jgi:hypothetical protein